MTRDKTNTIEITMITNSLAEPFILCIIAPHFARCLRYQRAKIMRSLYLIFPKILNLSRLLVKHTTIWIKNIKCWIILFYIVVY